MSNSFLKANHASPLIQVKSPAVSPSVSQASSPVNSNASNRPVAFFGSAQKNDLAQFGCGFNENKPQNGAQSAASLSPSPKPATEEEETKQSANSGLLLRGILRKKGMIFNNEREVTLSKTGVLNYYHFDKPGEVKGTVDLTSSQVQSIRFVYAGATSASSN